MYTIQARPMLLAPLGSKPLPEKFETVPSGRTAQNSITTCPDGTYDDRVTTGRHEIISVTYVLSGSSRIIPLSSHKETITLTHSVCVRLRISPADSDVKS